MCKKLISFICVLALASTTYGLVIGDWENDMDNWINLGVTISYSETGATLNDSTLKIVGASGWYTPAIQLNLHDYDLIDFFMSEDVNRFEIDVSRFAADWAFTEEWWIPESRLFLSVNADSEDQFGNPVNWGAGQEALAGAWYPAYLADLDPPHEAPSQDMDGTMHVIWDLSQAKGQIQALYDAGFDFNKMIELKLIINAPSYVSPVTYYLDNAQLLGTEVIEPEPNDPGTEGLVASYALEGDVTDGSGNGLDGVIMGDPVFVEGIVGQAIDLDGDGDYVDCGYNSLFDMETNQMTVATWVTIRSVAHQWAAIVAKGEHAWRLGNANYDPKFHFGISYGNLSDTTFFDGVTTVGFDEWHHVAGVFDGATMMIYLDGALDNSVPTTETIGICDANLLIGENPEAAGRYWDGLIDEVVIYNRALSDDEIAFLAR